ncbi:MAG: hypothetical protein PHI24_12160 [Desulfitobacteriaceae bacterium]|nr:hypothetical protein [Desulfitobacteriaceae bacterium]
MSLPTIPDVDPSINLKLEDSVKLLLVSVAFEELGLAHLINAEAEKIQYVLETFKDQEPTLDDLYEIDRSVNQTLRNVISKQLLLQLKLENTLNISTSTTTSTTSTTTTSSTTTTTTTTSTTTTTTTTSTTTTTTTTTGQPTDLGSAWSVGTHFGQGNAQYTTLGSDETEKTVVLGLGATNIPVGTVHLLRSGTDLLVTISTVSPYLMNQNHLYVDDVPPTNSAPGSFPYQYDPGSYFTTHTFTVDVSAYVGETLYVAAHAHILQQA